MPVNLKNTEFVPACVQAGSSSRTFHPEATGAEGKVQSKKTIPVETQTPTFTIIIPKCFMCSMVVIEKFLTIIVL